MDWTQCVVCQQATHEPLRCPLKAGRPEDRSEAYSSFLKNVSEFRELNQLPVSLSFGEDIDVDQFMRNKAKWHKSCHLKFCADKLQRARKRKRNDASDSITPDVKRLRHRQPLDKSSCIFCNEKNGHLHEFRTLDADENVRRMATDLQDTALLSTIEGGDLVALDAKYHLACLAGLRNRHRSFIRQNQDSHSSRTEEMKTRARAFVELITYVENAVEDGTFCFKFSLLRQLYESRLRILGIDKEINKGRFKEQVLEYFTNAQVQSDGKNMVLVFEKGIQEMLKQAMKCDHEGDALILMKAARIVREDIFKSKGFNFNGSFPSDCQQKSLPTTLKSLVTMLLRGADLMDQDSADSQACLSVSQTVLFNCKKSKKKDSAAKVRHSLEHEPPLPLYIGLNVHTQTRSKKLITQLYELGLSISYDRILQLENQLATAVCRDMEKKGVVCPAQLRKGLFTAGALDNLDHNLSSTTAKGAFHGTGTSLFQSPTMSNQGNAQDVISLQPQSTKNFSLPDNYTIVPAVALKKDNVVVPKPPGEIEAVEGHLEGAKAKERCWLEHAIKLMEKEELDKDDILAWSAYHASLQNVSDELQPALTQLLPLFHDKAATAAMIKHGMDVLREATQFLNPGQIPVIALDAPLYALAKYVQWHWPQTHGEDKYVAMFGGLHIEMAIWNTFGDYLEASGWTTALTQAEIASSGTADSFLKAAHLTRTRHAHQVSALALAKLQQDAFLRTEGPHDENTKEAWRQAMIIKSPTFQYWDTILRMEILGLIFVRAHREQDFPLYVESLKALVPCFFALDHQNYSRWISVHIRDMESLPTSIYQEFKEHGHWVVKKPANRFSSMPIDQAHEQNNELVKGSGGAVGLTENPSAFRKWMIAGPEQARLLKEFEREFITEGINEYHHHEEGFCTQKTFREQTLSLVETINEMSNPFLHDTPELLMLDTQNVLNESVVSTVCTVEAIGRDQYNMYHKSVIVERTRSIHDPIKKNSLPLFRSPTPKTKSKQAGQISILKGDVELFSRLYIVMQHREGDMNTFFKHENHPYPPSLSDSGKLRQGKKSDLLSILVQKTQTEVPFSVDVKILDGAAVVHFLSTTGITTFNDYASSVFIPHIMKNLESSKRVDVVWDTYIANSIKESVRERRGKGMRRKVTGQNKVPSNWPDFLRDSTNKQELFNFLSNKVSLTDCPDGKQIFITSGTAVISRGTSRSMQLCGHEEADTRIVFHLQDALATGSTTCLVRTVDTDVVVIIIGEFHTLLTKHPAADIWIAFGTGKNFQYMHINAICHALGKCKSMSLPIFHCFTGCDTTSAFFGKGKKTAWEAWNSYPEVTKAFIYMATHPHAPLTKESQHFRYLERFTVVLYDKTSSLESVDEARRELFCQKNRTMENIPPTQDTLLQHSKRVAYQAGIWTTSELAQQQTPTPDGHGWTLDRNSPSWLPVWSTLPLSAKACSELVKCSCKSVKGCGARCSCKKAKWKCTELCRCKCEK